MSNCPHCAKNGYTYHAECVGCKKRLIARTPAVLRERMYCDSIKRNGLEYAQRQRKEGLV